MFDVSTVSGSFRLTSLTALAGVAITLAYVAGQLLRYGKKSIGSTP
jgi:hypothetical protein